MKLKATTITLFLLLLNFTVSNAFGDNHFLTTLEEQVSPDVCAVLVVDTQNDYVADDGMLGKAGLPVKTLQANVPVLNKFIEAARQAGATVIWIKSSHSPADSLPPYMVGNISRKKGQMPNKADFLCAPGSYGQEYYKGMVKRLTSEPEVIKNSYSAFINTQLDAYLQAKGIKTIISTGYITDVCVGSTAKTGYFKGYYSIMPVDGSSSYTKEATESYLKNHRTYFGFTPTTAEIMNIWKTKYKK
ncbi:cysteine hydrolase [Maridesulfovibrio sp.]|uniref:cysteine hydrolase family protein n=1 Tax=Maridesulfovibrio sp. TaxID=2795000 RepID=UPI002A1884AF|nr:cysteine hydrolase [Maridesulfovibrio sp.]